MARPLAARLSDITDLHPEEVKAAIRKRYGSATEFERTHGLPERAFSDLIRGRASSPTLVAVQAFLACQGMLADENDDRAEAPRRTSAPSPTSSLIDKMNLLSARER